MRILHTSDWHLGRQFHNVSLLDDQRQVLDQIIGLVTAQRVDAVLVAGDIYDRSVPPAEAVALLDEVLDRITRELDIPVILIAGNHDGAERLAFGSRQLASSGLHIAGPLPAAPEAVILSDEHGEVAFYSLPYADPSRVREALGVEVHSHQQAMELLLAQIRADNGNDRRCVVLGHCFLEGGEESESERPLSVGGVDRVAPELFADFDYVALGHLHAPQHKRAAHVRYSGSILKYSFSEERQRKSVTLVDMAADGSCEIELIALNAPRDMRIVDGLLEDILAVGRDDPAADDYLLVRLQDRHAILDAMGKLRSVYPNVLHLERPALAAGGERQRMKPGQLERGLMPMFRDFYQQMSGSDLDQDSSALLETVIEELQHPQESAP